MDVWGPTAALFAALTFFGWLFDKYTAHRHRPKPYLTVEQDFSIRDNFDQVIGQGVTLTNMGSAEILFAAPPHFIECGDLVQHPSNNPKNIVLPGEQIKMVYDSIDPDKSYISIIVTVKDMERLRGTLITWRPVCSFGKMAEIERKQHLNQRKYPPLWVTGGPVPRKVGPDGEPFFFLPARSRARDIQQPVEVALGVRDARPKKATLSRRIVLVTWNGLMWVTRQEHRRFHHLELVE